MLLRKLLRIGTATVIKKKTSKTDQFKTVPSLLQLATSDPQDKQAGLPLLRLGKLSAGQASATTHVLELGSRNS